MLARRLNTQGSVYSLRKSCNDTYLMYTDDEKGKDTGPEMIIIKDEEEDNIDGSFPTAFSPTMDKAAAISMDMEISANENQRGTPTDDLYAKVIPKSQRVKAKEDLETSTKSTVSNGDVTVDVDPHAQYARVIPKSQRKMGTNEINTVANGSAATNGMVARSGQQKSKVEIKSNVLSAIGNGPMVVQADHKSTSASQQTANALGNRVTYTESAEL